MILDETAIGNLELLSSLREGKKRRISFSVLDMTKLPSAGVLFGSGFCIRFAIKEKLKPGWMWLKWWKMRKLAQIAEILVGILIWKDCSAKFRWRPVPRATLSELHFLNALAPTINLIKTAKTNLIKELHDELFGLKNLEPLKEKILATIRRILRYR